MGKETCDPISFSQRAGKAGDQVQDLILRVAELHGRLNSQLRQVGHANGELGLGGAGP